MGFDQFAFRQFLFVVLCLCTMVSLVAMTEDYPWWAPYGHPGFFTDRATAASSG